MQILANPFSPGLTFQEAPFKPKYLNTPMSAPQNGLSDMSRNVSTPHTVPLG